MALGGVAAGGERRHVFVEIERGGREERVDQFDDPAGALGGGIFQRGGEHGFGFGNGAGGEADAHVVGDAGFAGGIDFAVSQFPDEGAGFDAADAADVEQPGGFEEFVRRVEHVEIDDPGGEPAGFTAQPGDIAGRELVAVIGINGMAMEVMDGAFGQDRHFGGDPQVVQLRKRVCTQLRIHAVKFFFKRVQFVFADHTHFLIDESFCLIL